MAFPSEWISFDPTKATATIIVPGTMPDAAIDEVAVWLGKELSVDKIEVGPVEDVELVAPPFANENFTDPEDANDFSQLTIYKWDEDTRTWEEWMDAIFTFFGLPQSTEHKPDAQTAIGIAGVGPYPPCPANPWTPELSNAPVTVLGAPEPFAPATPDGNMSVGAFVAMLQAAGFELRSEASTVLRFGGHEIRL
ncbi:MAG TPA: hypothetical protein VLF69_03610 [Candidatus Saccharimonadales bacterium]|nr:hypothetical protein [Candidatus Saccharimonadales bacterium]